MKKKSYHPSEELPFEETPPHEIETPESSLGETEGSATGEPTHEVLAGGWEGTDDATSTAPSDFAFVPDLRHTDDHGPEAVTGRAFGGGILQEDAITDIKGTPVEESRDWESDPIVEER